MLWLPLAIERRFRHSTTRALVQPLTAVASDAMQLGKARILLIFLLVLCVGQAHGDALDGDHATSCMMKEKHGNIRVYPHQLEPFKELCGRRGWQGSCDAPCTRVSIDKPHGSGLGAPCISTRHPEIHPQPVPQKTQALLARASEAASTKARGPSTREQWRGKTVRVRSFIQARTDHCYLYRTAHHFWVVMGSL